MVNAVSISRIASAGGVKSPSHFVAVYREGKLTGKIHI
jgi:hypothetical protein